MRSWLNGVCGAMCTSVTFYTFCSLLLIYIYGCYQQHCYDCFAALNLNQSFQCMGIIIVAAHPHIAHIYLYRYILSLWQIIQYTYWIHYTIYENTCCAYWTSHTWIHTQMDNNERPSSSFVILYVIILSIYFYSNTYTYISNMS